MNQQYFSPHDQATPSEKRSITVLARGRSLQFKAADSVFSSHGLDPGTEQLLRSAPPLPQAGHFLDLGSGWGVLANYMALEAPRAQVLAVDVNPRALGLTAENARDLGATNLEVLPAAKALQRAHSTGTKFDVIWSNPPIRIGKPALRALLQDWLSLLSPTGYALLVVSKHLGSDSLARWLKTSGYAVNRISSKKGFRVLRVSQATSSPA